MKESTIPQTQEEPSVATREESRTLTPPVDIFEIPEGLAVVVDFPGVDKADVDVRVENDTLTLSGKAKASLPGNLVYQEYTLQNYFRQFQLSDEVDQEGIKADAKNGVLTIILPKAERAKPKKITVNVAS